MSKPFLRQVLIESDLLVVFYLIFQTNLLELMVYMYLCVCVLHICALLGKLSSPFRYKLVYTLTCFIMMALPKVKDTKKENLKWTIQMDETFIQAMLHQHHEGNRV